MSLVERASCVGQRVNAAGCVDGVYPHIVGSRNPKDATNSMTHGYRDQPLLMTATAVWLSECIKTFLLRNFGAPGHVTAPALTSVEQPALEMVSRHSRVEQVNRCQ